ncbi:hypothetical protein EON63_02480 [archaeon]|nr:MAG: hypothetical protein EON63_02480 [archaeon]
METSAKTALNVRNLFVEIGECVHHTYTIHHASLTTHLTPIHHTQYTVRSSNCLTSCLFLSFSKEAAQDAADFRARVFPHRAA